MVSTLGFDVHASPITTRERVIQRDGTNVKIQRPVGDQPMLECATKSTLSPGGRNRRQSRKPRAPCVDDGGQHQGGRTNAASRQVARKDGFCGGRGGGARQLRLERTIGQRHWWA